MEEDRLLPEDLLAGSVTDEWVRTAMYGDGHRVSVVGHSAWCGVQLVIDEWWWEQFQAELRRLSGYNIRAKGPGKWSPTDWFIARDTRVEGSRCTQCKVDLFVGAESDTSPIREVSPISEDLSRPFVDPSPADRLERQRFLTRVAMVARELDAEVLEADSV